MIRPAVLLSTTLLSLSPAWAQADRHGGLDEILVTARPYERSATSALEAGGVVMGEELERRMEGTLGETLAGLPGISSTYFGPGASRPVIRGLSGDRVRVLSGGIGSFDASSTSPDHAVALDPLSAERIEIVRGPGTLLYGGAAVGGVVNVLDGRIPTRLPDDDADGGVRLAYGTAAEERAAEAAATVSLAQWALHVDGGWRKTDDLHIPGFAESRRLLDLEGETPDPDEKGVLHNSDLEAKNGAIGLSYIADDGFLGVSYARTDMNYGVPGHAHDGEDAVRIDLVQDRFDLMGEWKEEFLVFKSAKIRLGYADYEHRELEGDEVGTVFTNEGFEGRLELVQQETDRWRGAVGVQVMHRDFTAQGDEAFVPPTQTLNWGLFAVEEFSVEPLTLEVGARVERQKVDADVLNSSRRFTSVSVSGGITVDLGDEYGAGVSFSRSERAPNAEELYSNGPHAATNAFEVGDVTLGKETALSVEGGVRKTKGHLTGALSLFYTRFDGFIYEAATGAEVDGLCEFQFIAADAEFYGGELEAAYLVYEQDSFNLTFDIAADIVRATLTASGEPLPRIPPKSLTLGITGQSEWYDARLEVELVDKQTRITTFELPTNGYALLNINLNVHPFDAEDVTLSLRAHNLTNRDARNHVSFLKDVAPLPGRDVRASVTYRF